MTLAGRLLVALPVLSDPNFDRTVVLLLDHGDDGAMGVVLNRPTDIRLGDVLPLWDLLGAEPAVVHLGGPVQPEGAIALGHGTELDVGPIDLDTDRERLDIHEIRVFAGYAGWSPGQLEDEILEGAWVVVDAQPADAFAPDPGALWVTVLRRQPGTLAWMANLPEDVSVN